MVCPKFNSHVYKLKRWPIGKHICFYFTTWGPKRHFYWGVHNVKKNWLSAQLLWLLSKREKCECTYELSLIWITLYHTIHKQRHNEEKSPRGILFQGLQLSALETKENIRGIWFLGWDHKDLFSAPNSLCRRTKEIACQVEVMMLSMGISYGYIGIKLIWSRLSILYRVLE
jgi:hypothetical protein